MNKIKIDRVLAIVLKAAIWCIIVLLFAAALSGTSQAASYEHVVWEYSNVNSYDNWETHTSVVTHRFATEAECLDLLRDVTEVNIAVGLLVHEALYKFKRGEVIGHDTFWRMILSQPLQWQEADYLEAHMCSRVVIGTIELKE